MAEDFQAPICGDNWWSSSRSVLVAVGGLSPCSVGIADLTWPPADDFLDIKPKYSATDSDQNNNSNSSMFFQDYSTFQMMGFALSSSEDNLLCGGGRGGESNFNSNNGTESCYNEQIRKEWSPTNLSSDSSSINGYKQVDHHEHQDYLLEQNRLNSINCSSTSISTPATCQGLFPLSSLDSTLYGYPSTKLLQNLYDDQQPPHAAHHPIFNTNPSINTDSSIFPTNQNDLSLSSTPNFPSNYIKQPSLPKPVNSSPLHFTNNTTFWNASAAPPSSTHIIQQGIASILEDNNPPANSQNTTLAFKPINGANSEDHGQEAKKGDKNNATEAPVFKRPRIETPSPLPTFKVRKEKLGDRVTALQQLVSPFGKTDTASVLHEAIEYIKFLHDQVSVLSTPYMKGNNGIIPPVQHQQVCEKADPDCPKQDLRSRGLCLVPISSTFPVTNATTADFWTPTFGGTFR